MWGYMGGHGLHDEHLRGAVAALPVGGLLLNLEALNNRRKLVKDLVGLLVVLNLGGNKLGEVAQRLGGVEYLGLG